MMRLPTTLKNGPFTLEVIGVEADQLCEGAIAQYECEKMVIKYFLRSSPQVQAENIIHEYLESKWDTHYEQEGEVDREAAVKWATAAFADLLCNNSEACDILRTAITEPFPNLISGAWKETD